MAHLRCFSLSDANHCHGPKLGAQLLHQLWWQHGACQALIRQLCIKQDALLVDYCSVEEGRINGDVLVTSLEANRLREDGDEEWFRECGEKSMNYETKAG